MFQGIPNPEDIGTFELGHTVQIDENTFVDKDVLGIVQKIHEYDPNLKVQYLEWAAGLGDPPYRIVEKCRDGVWRTIFGIWKLDNTVIDRLYAADTQKLDVLNTLDNKNANVKKEKLRRYREIMDSAEDIVKYYLKSSKGRWTVKDEVTGKTVTIDDDLKPSTKVKN